MLTALAGLLAYVTREEGPPPAKDTPASEFDSASPAPQSTRAQGVAVAAPPETSDPIEFAKAATKVLWTYDTRFVSQAEHLSGLKRWMTSEKKYADWKSVTQQVPTPTLWSRMHDNQNTVAFGP